MELDNIYVRPLVPDEWELLRRVRIRAVSMHTHYFLETPEGAENRSESFWRDGLSGIGKCIFGMFDKKDIIGISGVFTHREFPDGKTADFGMTFIEPAYRGLKLSRLFYEARINWARENGFERIEISHHIENEASKNANQRFGFKYVGEHMRDWPDGTRALDIKYELVL